MFYVAKGEAMLVYVVTHNEDGFIRGVFSSEESAQKNIDEIYNGYVYYHIQAHEVK
jgi:hypothetical protein